MMISGGGNVANGMTSAQTNKRNADSAARARKKNTDKFRKHNIDKIRDQSSRTQPEELHYKPKVSESFLEEWLNFPVDRKFPVLLNTFKMWMVWLVWTSRGMAGLDPGDTSIRARVCSQLSVLGSAAGLLLVLAIAGFLVPPVLQHEHDKIWLDIYGCLMFTASVCLIFYIGVSLTATYPLVESLRDDIAFDTFEHYQRRVGGMEVYLFFFGIHIVLIALLVAARILYTDLSLLIMIGVTMALSCVVMYFSRQIFLSLDPISSMHMGLTNDPDDQYRAELLSHFILRKIPNSIVDDPEAEDVFTRRYESQKYEHSKSQATAENRADLKHQADEDTVDGFANNDVREVHHRGHEAGKSGLWANVKVADVSSLQELEDIEGSTVPFAAKTKPGSGRKESSTSDPARILQDARLAGQNGASSSVKLPPLREMFCDADRYWFRSVDMPLEDSVEAYEILTKHRCKTAEELVVYLDNHRELRSCTCGAEKAKKSHATTCPTQHASRWTGALRKLGVPAFTANKVVTRLRDFLQ